jgi:hypothetical protein
MLLFIGHKPNSIFPLRWLMNAQKATDRMQILRILCPFTARNDKRVAIEARS